MRDATAAAAGLAVGIGTSGCQTGQSTNSADAEMPVEKTRSYNTVISAVSLGGHWKRLPHSIGTDGFTQNRRDVISACIEHGVNYVDACAENEILTYAEALRGRRDAMYFGCSYCEHEMRNTKWQTKRNLLAALDDILLRAKLDYVDLWRITCYWKPSTNHSVAHEHAIVAALEKARTAGKVRFTGISTHKHDWVIRMMETYPQQIQVVVVPYTAGSKQAHARVDPSQGPTGWKSVADADADYDRSMVSVIDAVKKNNCGWFGIKPFASGSIFKSRGAVKPETKDADDETARLTLRYILGNNALTAPIPGMITVDQVSNAARAVTEQRKLGAVEAKHLDQAVEQMWANLPKNYQWLKREWEYV
jgi:predicted aldo/keto reductase-like oxidoreductase